MRPHCSHGIPFEQKCKSCVTEGLQREGITLPIAGKIATNYLTQVQMQQNFKIALPKNNE